jgi:hypothetical protein
MNKKRAWEFEIDFGKIVVVDISKSGIPIRFRFRSWRKLSLEKRRMLTEMGVKDLCQHGEISHMVDMTSFSGSGECSCEDFEFRIRPAMIRSLIDENTPRARCKHIRKVREILADLTISAAMNPDG